MIRRPSMVSFVAGGLGRRLPTGTSSFIDSAFKSAREHLEKSDIPKAFTETYKTHTKVRSALEAIKIVGKGASTITGMLNNGENSPSNGELNALPYMSNSSIQSLGKNESIYYKTFVEVGKPTSRIIKDLSKGPYIEKVTKNTSSSSKDYQAHSKRKNLTLESGFCQKGYTFLLEDTYFSVQDYYDLFKIKERFSEELKENKRDGIKEIYGSVLKTKNQFKIKNRYNNFSAHVAIHLIKITDIRTNVRSLLQEIIHNSEQSMEQTNGKIPSDFQYNTPKIYDTKNRFGITFLANLVCSLSMSQRFREKAKIVKTWEATLPPGSMWDFNLTTHLGRGIHLNKINDFHLENPTESLVKTIADRIEKISTNLRKGKNAELDELRSYVDDLLVKRANEHPSSYVFVFEFVGDRRASVERVKENDIFSGYSPTKLSVEFETDITYLVNEEKQDELLVYKRTRQNKDFDENSPFGDIFCPDREIAFNVPVDQIGPKRPFRLLVDEVVGSENNILDDLKKTFEFIGLDPKSATPQDGGFDYKSDPNEGNTDQKPDQKPSDNKDEL